jgi:Protein of unknown function (DUF3892)
MAKIIGNGDGPNGRNDSYQVGNRKQVDRKQVVKEVKDGKHLNYHIYHRNNQEYVRDNPDRSKDDNVNR